MSKILNQLKKLLANDPKQALSFFEANKLKLFSKQNATIYASDLLKTFTQLQANAIQDQEPISCKNAITFYYSNRKLLKRIPIQINPDLFKDFQVITQLTENLENQFHAALCQILKKKTQETLSENEINAWMNELNFAQDLLEKSMAKIEPKPEKQYVGFKAKLTAALKKLTDKNPSLESGRPLSLLFAPVDAHHPAPAPRKSIEKYSTMLPHKKRFFLEPKQDTAAKQPALAEENQATPTLRVNRSSSAE